MGPLTQQWLPMPPGSTRFYSLPLPGLAGFFVMYPVTALTQGQLIQRQREIISDFRTYLHAQAAQLVGVAQRSLRYAHNPDWQTDALGLSVIKIFSDEQTDHWISLSGITEKEALSFEDGRTEITLGEGSNTTFSGVFQGYYREGENNLVFVQMDVAAGETPKVFRGAILPGARPVFVEIPYSTLEQTDTTRGWLYRDGWVGSVFEMPDRHRRDAGGHDIGHYLLRDGYDLETKPIDIQGSLPLADKNLLPYLVNEQEWQGLRSVEAGPDSVRLVQQWLSEGGSDFQLLPESIALFHKAQEELKRLLSEHPLYPDRKTEVSKIHSVPLWLVNGHGVLMQVWVMPHQPPRHDSWPIWVLDPQGRRAEAMSVRMVGIDPQTGRYVQTQVPAQYQRMSSGAQTLNLFDGTTEDSRALLKSLKWTSYEDKTNKKTKGVECDTDALFAFYDGTALRKDETRVWSSVEKRQVMANRRLTDLSGRVKEARENFRVHGLREEIIQDDSIIYRWTLAEQEQDGTHTGKWLRLAYALPHLSEEGGEHLNSIPVVVGSEMTVSYREDYAADSDQWVSETFKVYKGRGDSLILVHPTQKRRRYLVEFRNDPGFEGEPLVSLVRGFESGLDAFYSPPQWPIHFAVSRLRSQKETFGGGRILDMSSLYQEAGFPLGEGAQVYRYFFKLTEPEDTEIHFDLLLNEKGEIVKVFDESWQDEKLDSFNTDFVKTEIVTQVGTDEEALSPGSVRIYLRHLPPSLSKAVGQTRFFTVDLSPDPTTHNFLGHQVSVDKVHYRAIPTNPDQYLFPSEKAEGMTLSGRVDQDTSQKVTRFPGAETNKLEDWFTTFLKTYAPEGKTSKALNDLSKSEVRNTAFGHVLLLGLRTYVDSSPSQEKMDEFVDRLAKAALFVYAGRRENLAALVSESILGLTLSSEVPSTLRFSVMSQLFDVAVQKGNKKLLQDYRHLSLVLDKLPEAYRTRFLRVVGQPHIGQSEKEILADVTRQYYDGNNSHPARQWLEAHPVSRWLHPLEAAGSKSGQGTPSSGGGAHQTDSLVLPVTIVQDGSPSQVTSPLGELRFLLSSFPSSSALEKIMNQLDDANFVSTLSEDQISLLLETAQQGGPGVFLGLWTSFTGQTIALEEGKPSTDGSQDFSPTILPFATGAQTLALSL